MSAVMPRQPGNDPQVEALKIPPHSIESEQSTLGGLLLDNHAWDKIGDLLREEDFYRADHRLIWKHISKLIERGKPADVITVFESLDADKRAEATRPGAFLFFLTAVHDRRELTNGRTRAATPRRARPACRARPAATPRPLAPTRRRSPALRGSSVRQGARRPWRARPCWRRRPRRPRPRPTAGWSCPWSARP